GGGRGVAKVAGERELTAPAEGETVDGRDRRLGHLFEEAAALVAEFPPRPRLRDRHRLHLLDVRACGEGTIARAGEHNRSSFLVLCQLSQAVAQLAEQFPVERVQRLRAVQRDDRDVVFALDRDAQTATFSRRKSTIALVGAPGVNTSATPCSFSAL